MELEDRRDLLRLTALVARGLGLEGLDEYVPPSEQMAADLAERPEPPGPVSREREVLDFLSKVRE